MVKLLKQYIKKRLINLIDHRIGEHQNVFSAAASELPNSEDYSDDLFKLLYNSSHRIDGSLDLAASTTIEAFSHQWENLKDGRYLLSDPFFKENVANIISQQETLIKPEWFKGKKILDAGCGNGRWAYGLIQLGANVTLVDINKSAIQEAQNNIRELGAEVDAVVTPMERVHEALKGQKFDMVWSWGVLHHCQDFLASFNALQTLIADHGLLFMYLYGRETLDYQTDINLFKDRIRYNLLLSSNEQLEFLRSKGAIEDKLLHNYHDIYAPLINRRFTWDEVERLLLNVGFEDILRTIDHTEIWVRGIKANAEEFKRLYSLPPASPPYWFQVHPDDGDQA
jgi:2-polyprenyl-3-methyl-5-hydroxy-6-metoxy-1,4-benzoquinol methylase